MKSDFSLAVFISGFGSNLQAIIDAIDNGELNARIAVVISDQPNAYGLQRATKHHIPTHIITKTDHPTREEYDRALVECLETYQPQLIVLAGFMRIIGKTLLEPYQGKIINTHPSLLPKYPGLNTYQRALDAGDTKHGVTVHIVTNDLDAGPILDQVEVPILSDDTIEHLKQRTQNAEHQLLVQVINRLINRNSN